MEGEIAARVNGGASVTARLSADGGDQRIAVTGADAGAVLRDAGLFRNAYGGSLKLNLVQTGRGAYRGSFVMHDLRVQDAPALAKLLSAASIIGFLEQLDGKGLLFTTVSGSFTLADGMLTLTEAKAVGPSMGISAAGQVRPVDGQFALNGVISPLYAVNGLFEKLPVFGRLLGGKDGEGLIGFTYTLQGNAQDHQVTVNPLSMLTPGALRELIAPQTEMAPSQ